MLQQFVCFEERCWEKYSRESSRSSSHRKCDCGRILVAKYLFSSAEEYILLLSSVY